MRNTTLCHIEKDGKYLMLHRIKKKNDVNQDKWVGIGGGFEDGESPEQCNAREVFEETGLTLTSCDYRGIVTFVSDRWETEYMHIFTADKFEGELCDCDEGELCWVDKNELYDLPIWEGDKIFLKLIEDKSYPFFSLRLEYCGDTLISAILNNKDWKDKMNYCVYGAASNSIDPSFIKAGEDLGRALADKGHGVVFGGGAAGMMGAVARGIYERKGSLIGVAPTFFNVDGVLFEHCTEFVYTDTMRQRKQVMEERSDGFIVTPGGIGTYDEFFEILSLRQLGRHSKPIVLYNVNGYFDPLYEMLCKTAEKKFMKRENLELILVSDSCEEIIKYLENYAPVPFDQSALRGIVEEKQK